MQNGIPLSDEMQLQLAERYGGIEAWGGEMMDPQYSAAWAWAGNTPFKWGKQVGSHLGGTRNPLVVHWPERITDAGALRTHFTHAIDVGPTILDIAGPGRCGTNWPILAPANGPEGNFPAWST